MKTSTTLISVICLCLISVSVYGAEKDMLLEKLTAHEKSLWEAIKSKNMDAFSKATAPDILEIDPMGVVMNKQQLIDSFKQFTINDYTLTNFQIFMLDEDAAVLSYAADGSATLNGQTVPMKITHTTTYVEEEGKWWPKFHTETPIAPQTQTQ